MNTQLDLDTYHNRHAAWQRYSYLGNALTTMGNLRGYPYFRARPGIERFARHGDLQICLFLDMRYVAV